MPMGSSWRGQGSGWRCLCSGWRCLFLAGSGRCCWAGFPITPAAARRGRVELLTIAINAGARAGVEGLGGGLNLVGKIPIGCFRTGVDKDDGGCDCGVFDGPTLEFPDRGIQPVTFLLDMFLKLEKKATSSILKCSQFNINRYSPSNHQLMVQQRRTS